MKKLLIIEDDLDLRELIASSLEEDGYSVKGCSDGSAGLEVAADWPPDIIILDLIMPTMNGFEFLRKMLNRDPNAAVIVLSGYLEKETEEIIVEMGVKDFLRKPLNYESLLGKISDVGRAPLA